MKLRNKKTGEIVEFTKGIRFNTGENYQSIKEVTEEWEDYQEPKEYWYITDIGCIGRETEGKQLGTRESIGNYFETKEEAEKAVEKLKAWKRLKDKGFRFEGMIGTSNLPPKHNYIQYYRGNSEVNETYKDFDLLFGGEEK